MGMRYINRHKSVRNGQLILRRSDMEKEHVLSVIKNHWNKKAAEFNIDCNADEIRRWEKVLSEFLGRDKSKNVVDIGTGTGFLANITGKLGHPTIGMDLSREMQEKWYQRYLGKNDDIMFKIVKKTEPEAFIGAIALYDIDQKEKTSECGRTVVDKGLAPEKGIGLMATKAVCLFGFEQLGLKKIVGDIIGIRLIDHIIIG